MARFPELEGKVALITGAGRRAGLGEGIARRLLQEGCTVRQRQAVAIIAQAGQILDLQQLDDRRLVGTLQAGRFSQGAKYANVADVDARRRHSRW